ncbi:LPS-assembly protein LptD [Moraxella oblonga]|uniref:LPS-assembly protein LptD n=1 Tax=Moraxella oblonga TaxID=200413 RepID=UPI00083563B5|nr:LPS assembly protein LptD [Moraxella oblonga]
MRSKHHHGQSTLTTGIQIALVGVSAIGLLPHTALANPKQNANLKKLTEYYHTNPDSHTRCHGAWVQPKSPTQTKNQDEDNATGVDTSDGTVFAQADMGYWDNDDYAELSGDVIIEQSGRQVRAEKVTFKPSTGEINADGQVLFADGNTNPNTNTAGIIGVADNLKYADNQSAIATDIAFASTTMNAHGHAKQMTKHNNSHYEMQDVMFSTCPPNERKWHLDADSIDINTDTGRGIAKNAKLNLGDTPIFYLPYLNFPIDDRRATGFLLPNAGVSSDRIEINTPYYINLAPNYDLTLTPTIYSNTNPMLTGEFRYLTQNLGSGILTGSYLPNDKNYDDQDRSRLFYDHDWHSKKYPHLSVHGTYRYVSDRDYLNDFDTLGLENNPLNLPRRIWATYYNEHVNADLRVETFQSLDGTKSDGTPITDKDKPYSRLPQLSVNYTLPSNNALQLTGIHNTAYFKKSIKDNSEVEKSGVRMYNQLLASYPITKSWGYVTPKFGLTHLYASYDEDSLAGQNLTKEEGRYSIFAPHFSVDSGLFFEKQGSPFGWFKDSLGGYQTVSPRLKYTYTPYKNQANIPNFETDVATISYDQLLSDSWFLGYDRIQDLHAVTPAINYRYVDKNGLTRFDAGVAEQFLLEKTKVGIEDSQTFDRSHSGLAWQMSTQPKQNLWVDFAGALNPDYRFNSAIAQVRYQPNDKSLFNVGMIERKENKFTNQLAMSAYTASAIFPINNRWRVLSQAQYDHKNSRLLDALVGINYEDCCYGISVYARQYRNDLSPDSSKNHAIMAEVRLNGITSGGKLNRLLSDKVMGYDTAQQAWQRAY